MTRHLTLRLALIAACAAHALPVIAQTQDDPTAVEAAKAPPLTAAQITKMFRTATTPEARAAAYEALAPFTATGDAGALRLLARELRRDNRFADAMAALAPLIAANDEEGLTLADKIISSRKSGIKDPALALDINERLIELGDLDALGKVAKAQLAGQIGRLTPEEVRAELQVAAEGGISNLSGYLADYQARGLGGPVDQEGAIAALRLAADAGERGRNLDLAKALMKSDDPAEVAQALDSLAQIAADENSGEAYGAQLTLITGHVTKGFGDNSDVQTAISLTQAVLASDKGDKAVKSLLRTATRTSVDPDWRDTLVGWVLAKLDAGDLTHLGVLFDHYAARNDDAASVAAQDLLDRFGGQFDSDYLSSFAVKSAIDSGNPMRRAAELAKILGADTSRNSLERAYRASTGNANLFTYLMQDLAARKGNYDGRLSGILDQSTLRAFYQLCREGEVRDACITGPLRRKNSKLIASAAAGLAIPAN